MGFEYLKKATKISTTDETDVQETVKKILSDISVGREAQACAYARKFDGWEDEIVVRPETITIAATQLSDLEKHDIGVAHQRVHRFAQAQLESTSDFEFSENWVALKQVPVNTAGCYVPGGLSLKRIK